MYLLTMLYSLINEFFCDIFDIEKTNLKLRNGLRKNYSGTESETCLIELIL